MKVKGTAIKNVGTYIAKDFGAIQWLKLLGHLPEEFKNYLPDGHVYTTRWYPFELYIQILNLAEEMFGTGDKKVIFENARSGAISNMNTIFKLFIKTLTPEALASKIPLFFSHFFDFGVMMVEKQSKGHIIASIPHIDYYPIFFVRISGYLKGMLDVIGVEFSNVSYNYDALSKKVSFDMTFQPKR